MHWNQKVEKARDVCFFHTKRTPAGVLFNNDGILKCRDY